MAQQRVKSKSERQPVQPVGTRDRRKTSDRSSHEAETLEEVRRQRDAAVAELDAAKARISDLESRHEQVVNRIDWVIDSLHTLKEGKS